MSWEVKVTKDNVARMDNVARSMRVHLEQLLKQLQEYPLEVHFEGYCIFFDNERDVRNFIDWLEEQVESVRPAA